MKGALKDGGSHYASNDGLVWSPVRRDREMMGWRRRRLLLGKHLKVTFLSVLAYSSHDFYSYFFFEDAFKATCPRYNLPSP